ncbi:Fic family protein [Bifidobacterium sp. ESL0769]|uniref:Fic family protein n=1 Tax=Bifidobacterium sp. ESL0769 TaxID=2983229 RepID=UPI0023F9A358|nr:Fic family protein [Bifidobacterium sp. ESL0769]WEV66855.1 Fic family protein [Bifidobacterium sp. ESL0769]
MTPAERASAIAFSYKNCELSAIVPSDAMVTAANGYQRGTINLSNFVETPELTARRKRCNESQLRDDRIFARSVRLIDYGWPARGGLEELKTIHRGLFVGAVAGAGKLRDDGNTACQTNGRATNQSNRNDDLPIRQHHQQQSPYFPSSLIETGAANIFSQLDGGSCFAGLDRAGFIHALASIYDELNALHPFAYGNGMVLRMFISELTHAVGWDLNWGTVTFESYRNATNLALFEHDISELERMYGSITRLANPTRIFLISGWDQGPAH